MLRRGIFRVVLSEADGADRTCEKNFTEINVELFMNLTQ